LIIFAFPRFIFSSKEEQKWALRIEFALNADCCKFILVFLFLFSLFRLFVEWPKHTTAYKIEKQCIPKGVLCVDCAGVALGIESAMF
jgi:hypothetical protein